MDYLPQSSLSKSAQFYGNYQCQRGDYFRQTLRFFSCSRCVLFDVITLLDYVSFKREKRVLTVPLGFWQPLVKKSATFLNVSILFIEWLTYLIPNYRDVSVLGFQKKSIKKIFRPFNNDKPSTRHNWESEYKLLAKWKQDGLHFIDDHEKALINE